MGVGEEGIQGNFRTIDTEFTTPDFTTGGVITSEENMKYIQKLEVNNPEGQRSQYSGATTGSTGPYVSGAPADACLWCCCLPTDCCCCCCCTDSGGDCDCNCGGCECGDCDCGGCDCGSCDLGGCDCGGC